MLILLEDCKNCVNLESFDEPICFSTRNYNFIKELEIVDEIYAIEAPVFVTFVPFSETPALTTPSGTRAKGNYGLGNFATRDGKASHHLIVLDSNLDLIEAATILIHEYAHVLSQQNHGFVMYELWREYLREEFVRRWNGDAERGKDTSASRDRVILVGEVCGGGEDQHLQKCFGRRR